MAEELTRNHADTQEYLQQLHEQEMEKLRAEAARQEATNAHEIALITARLPVESIAVDAEAARARDKLSHIQSTERWWAWTERSMSSIVTLIWVIAAFSVLATVLWINPSLTAQMTSFVIILTLMYNVAEPAAKRVIGSLSRKDNGESSK